MEYVGFILLFINEENHPLRGSGMRGFFAFLASKAFVATFLFILHALRSGDGIAPNGYTVGSAGGAGVEG